VLKIPYPISRAIFLRKSVSDVKILLMALLRAEIFLSKVIAAKVPNWSFDS
jgi:hypothetical protein